MPKNRNAPKLPACSLSLLALLCLTQTRAVLAAAPEDPGCRACLQSASGMFARGDNQGAAKLLTQWQAKCPNNLQLFLMLNTVLMRIPDGKKQALEAAEQACALAPDSMLPHFQKAMTLMTLQQGSAAAQEFQRVVAIDPTSYEAWLALSELLGAQGKGAAAKDAENHAAQLSPSARRSMLSTLESKDRAGNIQALKQEVHRLVDDPNTGAESLIIVGESVFKMGYFEEAALALNQAKTKYPDAPQVRTLLPYALFEQGKIEESRQLCQAEKGTADGAGHDVIEGLDALASGQFETGQKLIEKAAPAANPGITYMAHGYMAMQSGHYREAIEKFSDAMAKNPALTVARIYIAAANLELSDWKEAISQAQECQQKASGLKVRADALELIARLRDGEDSGANLTALRNELVAYAPRLSPKDQAAADSALAELTLRDKDTNRARELYNSALSHMPSFVPAHIGLARVAIADGDSKSALSELDKVLAQAPGSKNALALKALALIDTGDIEGAEANLTRATAEGELPGSTCLALGKAYQKAGENKKAIQYFKQAMQAGLDAPGLNQAKEAIKSLGEAATAKQ